MADILTKTQVEDNVKNSASFGIEFLVANQPNIILDRLKENGYASTDTPAKAEIVLNNLLTSNPELLKELVNEIPYDNSRENWTGGLAEIFPEQTPQRGENTGLWGGILTGLGGLATAIGGALGGSTGTGGLTPTQLAAMQQQELVRQQQEKERRQQNMLIFGALAVVVIIIIAVMYKQSKKSK